MNKLLLTLLLAPLMALAGPVVEPTPIPTTITQDLFGVVQGASEAHAIVLQVYPTYARGLAQQWGVGAQVSYPINQFTYAGLRLDALDGNYYAASAQAGLKADVQVLGLTVTPDVHSGVVSPLSGAGDKNQSVGYILGTGASTLLWHSKDTAQRLKVYGFGGIEYWSNYDKITILQAGVRLRYDF